MLRKVLQFASYFDWVSPWVAILRDCANRPSHTFVIPVDCGWSAFEIQRVLRGHGIKTWGLMIVKGSIMVSMRLTQAYWAQYLLERGDIPIEYGVLEERPVLADRRRARDEHPAASIALLGTGIWAEIGRTLRDVVDEISDLFKL